MNRLTPFQAEVARRFFALPESKGYLLAGGGALLASGLSSRPTRDLDFAGTPGLAAVDHLAEQFMRQCLACDWTVEAIQVEGDFARVLVSHVESLVVDIVLDSPAVLAPITTEVGPVFAGLELAARKLSALFVRAEARDFADVYVLSQFYDRSEIVRCARQVDLGIDNVGLAESMRTIDRFSPAEIPLSDHLRAEVHNFFASWAEQLMR